MVGPGEPGQSTGVWVISIFGGPPQKIHEDAEGAVLSPDGSKIAFLHENAGDWEIWTMGANGESPQRVVAGQKREGFDALQWSPDNTYLAYLSSLPKPDGLQTEIRALRPDTGQTVTIVSDPNLQSYTWLGDNRVVFALSEPPPNQEDANLWQIGIDAKTAKPVGDKRRVTDWAGFQFYNLSATSDAKRLTFMKARFQANIYLGEAGNGTVHMAAPQQFTSGERRDLPTAWTRDGKSLFFLSDRNGSDDIYKQEIGRGPAQQFLIGPEQHAGGEVTPDGAWLLYFSWPRMANGEHPTTRTLQRIPVGGGASQPVLTAAWDSQVRCSEQAPGTCILSEEDKDAKQLTFTQFDPTQGKKGEVARVDLASPQPPGWDIALDGSAIAVAGFDSARKTIRVIPLRGGIVRNIAVEGPIRIFHVAWSHEKGFFVSGASKRQTVLLHVDENGKTQELWSEDNAIGIAQPLPSPDGKRIAFSIFRLNSNVWMLENF